MSQNQPAPLPRRSFLSWTSSVAAAAFVPPLLGVATSSPVEAATAAALAPGSTLDDRLSAGTGWRDFLGGLDMVFESIPTSFYQGPFLGNGGMGASVYQRSGTNRLAFVLGDTRVRDHQGGDPLWGNSRLQIGYLTLQTTGTVTAVDLRLSLWNAELSGFVTTTAGVLQIRAFVHATRDLLVVSSVAVTGSETATWTFTAFPAVSPRSKVVTPPSGLLTNPAAVVTTSATGGSSVQDLACGGRTVTQWSIRTEADGVTSTMLCTIAHSGTDHSASTTAANTLGTAASLSLTSLTTEHRTWWNAFYPKSFVSVPDTKYAAFYWTQMYKLASATRADRPVMATVGPWIEDTRWPAAWYNLNAQLEYWPVYASGHTELDSLTAEMGADEAGLIARTPAAYRSDSLVIGRTAQEDLQSLPPDLPGNTSGTPEVGNLTWALHNVWLAYRHTMDQSILQNILFPRLRKAINFYLHFLSKDASGVYHLPATYSPEYGNTKDCNYDLALIHWGCRTLLASATKLGINDPLAATWQDVLDHLTPPPQDTANGLWIGSDLQLTTSHRHFSHLLWFYPLYELQVTEAANRTLLVNSINHWQSMPSALQGYSFTGSASMYAVLGDGDSALRQLNTLLTSYVQPNTMYAESGGPVIETPLSGAQTMHDMVVQSWGGLIRVFPAVPSAWADLTFHNLTTEGAFQVSAVRQGGVTKFIRVRSNAGEPCVVLPGGMSGPYDVQPLGATPGPISWTANANGTLTIALDAGDEAVIVPAGQSPTLAIAPVIAPARASWGLVPAAGGVPLDLGSFLSNDGITWQTNLTDGSFDTYGYTYPAEEMPTPGLFVSGGITWTMPGYGDGRKNSVVPSGQTVPVPAAAYTELHILGASAGGSQSGTMTLVFDNGTTQSVSLGLTDWGQKPQYGEKVAVQTSHRHYAGGDHALKVKVMHQTVTVAGHGAKLTGITLPSASRMRIFAMTVR
ncbi:glycosyl hydrolase family 95 catalytic domain-containing protein [Streptomyces sp. NPDC002671]